MTTAMDVYFEALQRLIEGRGRVVPPGAKICNDSVALEAGRTKGSIKKSRETFRGLIDAIRSAEVDRSRSAHAPKAKISRDANDETCYREKYETVLAEHGGMLLELWRLSEELIRLQAELAAQEAELNGYKARVDSTVRRIRPISKPLRIVPHPLRVDEEPV